MRIARAIAVVSLLGAAGGLVVSCFVSGFVRVEGEPAGGGGAVDAGEDASGGAGGELGCVHATWPSPPASADPGANTEDFVVAVRSVDFGEREVAEGSLIGYDLDNRCTCQGEGPSCNEPEWATADHCDGPEGRDNAVAQIFASFAPLRF